MSGSEFALAGSVAGTGSPLLGLAAVITLFLLVVVVVILLSLVMMELIGWCFADGPCADREPVDIEVVAKAEFEITVAEQTVSASLGGDATGQPGECSVVVAPFAGSGFGCEVAPRTRTLPDRCNRPQDSSPRDSITPWVVRPLNLSRLRASATRR